MKRSAFTLVELLVVLIVIALLAAILIPAVNRAREAARRAACVNKQRDLAFAMIAYNNANNGLPGYLNQLGNLPIHSWAISVFPMIGENKRYEILMKGESVSKEALISPPILLCPSSDSKENSPLDYVVNCGPADVKDNGADDSIVPPFSLFKDRRPPLNQTNKKVKIEEIPDGASNTILLSENVDAITWWDNWTSLPISPSYTRDIDAVKSLGFIWSRDLLPNSPAQPQKPRPSSKHPGTVVVAYADGTAKPINDDISIPDWLQAVCPDDAKVNDELGWVW